MFACPKLFPGSSEVLSNARLLCPDQYTIPDEGTSITDSLESATGDIRQKEHTLYLTASASSDLYLYLITNKFRANYLRTYFPDEVPAPVNGVPASDVRVAHCFLALYQSSYFICAYFSFVQHADFDHNPAIKVSDRPDSPDFVSDSE